MDTVSKAYNHQQSSIELGRDKKGDYSWTIKLYFGNGMGTLDEALAELGNIDLKLQHKFLENKGPENNEPQNTRQESTDEKEHASPKVSEHGKTNGWATDKQIGLLYAKARRTTGIKDEKKLEQWLIEEAWSSKIISEKKSLKHFSTKEASSLIEELP